MPIWDGLAPPEHPAAPGISELVRPRQDGGMASSYLDYWYLSVQVDGTETDVAEIREVVDQALQGHSADDPRLLPGVARVMAADPAEWLSMTVDLSTVLTLRDAMQCLLREKPNDAGGQSMLEQFEDWLEQARCPTCQGQFVSCGCEHD